MIQSDLFLRCLAVEIRDPKYLKLVYVTSKGRSQLRSTLESTHAIRNANTNEISMDVQTAHAIGPCNQHLDAFWWSPTGIGKKVWPSIPIIHSTHMTHMTIYSHIQLAQLGTM